uniref:FBA_2 domain-containing protein n=1 Tax=Caenorhabditis tropicalis TaxID=1561998 RepID=A0A1I7U258_9PELO
MNRFPIFKLPLVAHIEVMKMFHLFDLTTLSMCSKRVRNWIKTLRIRRYGLRIMVTIDDDISIEFYNQTGIETGTFTFKPFQPEMLYSAEFEDSTLPMYSESTTEYLINLCADDKVEGVQIVCDYLRSFFGIDISYIIISPYSDLNDSESFMNWVTTRQKRIEGLSMECSFNNNYTPGFIIERIKNIETVSLDLSLSSNFKTNFEFEGEYIEIYQAHWFKLNNLLKMNCLDLLLKGTRLTNMDMNVFLKHWMTKDLKFKEICIEMEVIRFDVLFSEIPVVERTDDVERDYRNSSREMTIIGGFDIKGMDGVTATMVPGPTGNNRFWMIVWEKQEAYFNK